MRSAASPCRAGGDWGTTLDVLDNGGSNQLAGQLLGCHCGVAAAPRQMPKAVENCPEAISPPPLRAPVPGAEWSDPRPW